jgi:putative transcriptional regulator
MTEEKYCPKCDETKPVEDFYKRGKGLQSDCKQCTILYTAAVRKALATVRKSGFKFNRIREVLEIKNIDGNTVAFQIGRDNGVFHRWLRNEVQPPIHSLFEIADVLNIKPSELINDAAQEMAKIHSEKYIVKESFIRFPILYKDKNRNDLNFEFRANWIEGYNAALNSLKL